MVWKTAPPQMGELSTFWGRIEHVPHGEWLWTSQSLPAPCAAARGPRGGEAAVLAGTASELHSQKCIKASLVTYDIMPGLQFLTIVANFFTICNTWLTKLILAIIIYLVFLKSTILTKVNKYSKLL